jgi:hypothetical protein
MANIIHTSVLSHNNFFNSKSFLDIIHQEIKEIKKVYVYQDPYNAAYLIKWEIETPDYSFVKEDF